MIKYNVWRHYRIIFTGTFSEVKKFIAANTDSYQDKVLASRNLAQLNNWNGCTEYCHVKKVD